MSLVGYIWNKWGSVPASLGKPTRSLLGCLGDSRLGVFSPSSVDGCWGTLPLHTSVQQYKCAALVLQLVTDQLLICINLSRAGGHKIFLQTYFFLLSGLKARAQLSRILGYSSCSLLYKLKHVHIITLLKADTDWVLMKFLFVTNAAAAHLLGSVENFKAVAIPWTDLFNPEVLLGRVEEGGQDDIPLLFWAWVSQEYFPSLILNGLENTRTVSREPCSLISKGQNPQCVHQLMLSLELIMLLRSGIALSLTHWKTIRGRNSLPRSVSMVSHFKFQTSFFIYFSNWEHIGKKTSRWKAKINTDIVVVLWVYFCFRKLWTCKIQNHINVLVFIFWLGSPSRKDWNR